MAFVAIGFQYVVADMFVIPAAIFAGYLTWGDYFQNFVPVLLGNAVRGSIFVAAANWFAYKRQPDRVATNTNWTAPAPILKRNKLNG